MPTNNKIIVLLLAVFFVATLSSPASCLEKRWSAGSLGPGSGWQILNSEYSASGGALVLRSAAAPRLVSPAIEVPASESVLEIVLDSPADGTGAVGLALSGGSVVKKYFKLSPGKKAYRVYLGDSVKEGFVQGFVVEFYGGAGKEYRLDSIGFFKPSASGLLRVFWDGFMEPETIKVSTINSISTPSFGPAPLPLVLYGLVAVITAVLLVPRFFGRRPLDGPAVAGAVAAAFFISATALAARMDYNWIKLTEEESRTLSAKTMAEKIAELNGPETAAFLSFVDFVKKSIPDGKTVAPAGIASGERLPTLARYYLLPVLTSSKPDYIWVYNDPGIYYDPADSSLKKGSKVIASKVKPFKPYSVYSAVYETIR